MFEGVSQGLRVDYGSASGIDEDGAFPHPLKVLGIHQPSRLLGQRDMQTHEVTSTQQVVQGNPGRLEVRLNLGMGPGARIEQSHAE
jgi:hypothetical protein